MVIMCDLGVVGMGVMGRNFALNCAEKGFNVGVYNRTGSKTSDVVQVAAQKDHLTLYPFYDLELFVASLSSPKKIFLFVQAGKAVDDYLNVFYEKNLVEPQDIIVDCGNEHFVLTERRHKEAKVNFLNMGVSGGEEGARHGPSMMPGGSRQNFEALKPILEKVAAHTPSGEPCVRFMGSRSAGGYVKMVHNGIEYGIMGGLAEIYAVAKAVGYSNPEIATLFEEWSKSELLGGFLVEITGTVLRAKNGELIEQVEDIAGSKGTGKWTSEEALELGVPCPTIQAALESRYMSALKDMRVKGDEVYGPREVRPTVERTAEFASALMSALYMVKACAFAQGFMLMREGSKVHDYDIDLKDVAAVWREGCIIRDTVLKDITAALQSDIPNLLTHPDSPLVQTIKNEHHDNGLLHVVQTAMAMRVAVPVLSNSLTYFETLRTSRMNVNLIQGQRDHFGAHTFQMIGKSRECYYHADWVKGELKEQ